MVSTKERFGVKFTAQKIKRSFSSDVRTVYFSCDTDRTVQEAYILEFSFGNFFVSENHGVFMWTYRLSRSLFGPCHFDVEHGLDYPLENPNIYC